MSIATEWHDNAQTIIVHTINGPWTWAELDREVGQAMDWVRQQEPQRRVDIIFNFVGHRDVPAGGLKEMRSYHNQYNHLYRCIVYVGASQFSKLGLDALQMTYPDMRGRHHFVGTFDDALQKIEQLRATEGKHS